MTQLKSRPFQIFLAARLLLTALGLGIYALGLMKPLPDPVVMPLHQYQVPATGLTLAFFGVWERFDVLSYIQIAAAGYYNTFVSVFYPLLPALLRVFAPLLGGNLLFTGLLISNVACLLALYLFDDLLTRDGFEQATTNRALTNLMFWPQAVFLLVGYTESIFLLLCLISFWAARRGWWWVAGLAGLAASLTHFQGVVLGAVLVWEYLRQNGWRPPGEPGPFCWAACPCSAS